MLTLSRLRLRTARVGNRAFAVDELVDVVLAAALEVLESRIEIQLVSVAVDCVRRWTRINRKTVRRQSTLYSVRFRIGVKERREPSKLDFTPLRLIL